MSIGGKEPTDLSGRGDQQVLTPPPSRERRRRTDTVTEGMPERRHDRRKRVEVLGWITSPGKGRPCCIVCRDLASAGAQFTAPIFIAPTERLHMSLQLHPAGGPVECDGDVCWSRMMDDGYCHFGIRFLNLAEIHGTRLGLFLEGN